MKKDVSGYTEWLFSRALKKSGNLTDAEELTQEVLLAALAYQGRGGEIVHMPSWLSSTLSHKWNDMLRRKYRLPMVSIDRISERADEGETRMYRLRSRCAGRWRICPSSSGR